MVLALKLEISEGLWLEVFARIAQILLYVKTIDYSAIVNGNGVRLIIPDIGLWQRDSWSSYLLITICVEGLSTLLVEAEARDMISMTLK